MVGSGFSLWENQIAAAVREALGKPDAPRANVDERPGQVDRHIGTTEKAERLLGWRARTSFEEGLARTVEWYRLNDGWWRGILQKNQHAFSS
jgi:dTDP-glucose 4,6-dehydratase